MSHTTLTLTEIRDLARRLMHSNGMVADSAEIIADLLTTAERDGPKSHGLNMAPNYVNALRSGWSNGKAVPTITRRAGGTLTIDGDNGYAQIATAAARPQLLEMARDNGIAILTVENTHHIGALRYDTEPLAEAGCVALAVANSRAWIAPHGGTDTVFGTNPMSFACPRDGGPPIVWDQASAVVALTDIRMAAAQDEELHAEAGIGADGQPTRNAQEILDSGKLLGFGGHKGTGIALMIEILAAGLAGARLSPDDRDRAAASAVTARAGHTIIAIDPGQMSGGYVADAAAKLTRLFDGNGTARVPGDGRLARRQQAQASGVEVRDELLDRLNDLMGTE